MTPSRSLPIICALLPLLTPCGPLRAEVRPSPLFSDNAVLQQGVTIPVWGTASPGEKITVRLDDKEVSTMTGRDGKWTVQLPPQVGGGPHTMTIAGTTNKVTATNVLTGEVWVSAGQSNMAFDLKKVTGASNEISKADYPTLRAFRVSSKGYALPQETLPRGEWVECSPNTAGSFSAVGYYFARDLIKARRVPVGLIETAWSGTPAEAWTGLDGLSNEKELRHYADTAAKLAAEYPGKMRDLPRQFSHYWAETSKWNETSGKAYQKSYVAWDTAAKAAKAAGKPAPPPPAIPTALPPSPPSSPDADEGMPKTPAVIYNGRIAPITRYPIKGVIWYQAEGNTVKDRQPSTEKCMEYRTLFPCLIADWRQKWGLGDFPFLFVQLPQYVKFPPEIRESQLLTLSRSTNSAMAVTADLGYPEELHPPNKEPIGVRLALAARALAYGEKIEYSGPLFQSMKVEDNRAILSFAHTGAGLVAKEGDLKGFTLAGTDGKFVPAKAEIVGETVVVSAPGVTQPVAVRYGWANVPDGNLFNKEGLPASPFRTDGPAVPSAN